MPQLQSGRHVGVLPLDLTEGLLRGTEEAIYWRIVLFRLTVHQPWDLVRMLPVIYFEEQEDETPRLKPYRSGFQVVEVLDGRACWRAQETEEFRVWLEANATLREWSESMYNQINALIRDHMIWDGELVTGISPAGKAWSEH